MTRHAAIRLPVEAGPAAWNAILPPQAEAMPLAENTTADIVIVGGGFAGLSAARRILQLEPRARVALLEAGRIANGAAGRNTGFMIDLPHELTSENYAGGSSDRTMIGLNRQAIAFARDAVEEYGIARDFFDPAGKINGAVAEAADVHNQSYARHLKSLGEPFEHLDGQQMQEITGSGHYRSGLYTPGTVMLQPAGYIRGLAGGLAAQGVAIHENSPVLSLTRQDTAWRVECPHASVSCERVILANNGHLESFGFAKGRLMQLFLFASMTPELGKDARARLGGVDRWGITPSDPMGTTMRRIDPGQGGHRIVTRTCALLKPGMRPSQKDVDWAARVQRRKFDARFPQLAGLKMEHRWAGHLCLSMNGVSVLRELEPGLFSACVQNGLGTTRGTLTGIGAAEIACGTRSEVTRHFGEAPEPSRLPPQPFRQIGANALIRWKEWRASEE